MADIFRIGLLYQTANAMQHRCHRLPRLVLAILPLALTTPLAAQSLRGSPASVNRMYNEAVDNGIYFFKTGKGIRDAADTGRFVKLKGNKNYDLDGVSYPYVRPATRTFVQRLAGQYRAACGERLVVTSASRPEAMHLFNSVDKTVHPTGMAVDLRKSHRSSCLRWMRQTLLTLEGRGVIEATEEHHPAHFHVAVFPAPYREYVAERGGHIPRPATPSEYRVRAGDSLWAIARRNETTVAQLKSANKLSSSSIRIGQVLVIPEGAK